MNDQLTLKLIFLLIWLGYVGGISCVRIGGYFHIPWLINVGLLIQIPGWLALCIIIYNIIAHYCLKLYNFFRSYTDTRTIQGILKNSDATAVINELNDYFTVKYRKPDYELKVISHRVVWMLCILQAETKKGGVTQYIGGYYGKHFKETRSLLTMIGATKTVQALDSAEQYFGEVPENGEDHREIIRKLNEANSQSYDRNISYLTDDLIRSFPGACRSAVAFVKTHVEELDELESKFLKAIHRMFATQA